MNPIIHKTAEVSSEAKIGQGTKIWHHSQVLAGAQIGENCTIGHNCFIASTAKIGNGVKLESNIDIWDLVTLEDYVFVGPSVVFTNDLIPRAKYPKKNFPSYGKWRPTLVKNGASIGANATVLCDTIVGKSAIVGAGSLVSKEIPDYAIVVGNPAKIIGWACECGNKLVFKNDKADCGMCARSYKKNGDQIAPLFQ